MPGCRGVSEPARAHRGGERHLFLGYGCLVPWGGRGFLVFAGFSASRFPPRGRGGRHRRTSTRAGSTYFRNPVGGGLFAVADLYGGRSSTGSSGVRLGGCGATALRVLVPSVSSPARRSRVPGRRRGAPRFLFDVFGSPSRSRYGRDAARRRRSDAGTHRHNGRATPGALPHIDFPVRAGGLRRDPKTDGFAPMSIPQSGGGPSREARRPRGLVRGRLQAAEDWRIGTEHEKFGYCKGYA